jgi:methylthioribose-1-phosphate isomerase
MKSAIYPVYWQDDRAILIDQLRLPAEYTTVAVDDYQGMAAAIKTMIVRGAPAIGVAAAYGMYLGARSIDTEDRSEFLSRLQEIGSILRATRPTAVNLFWAIDRMEAAAREFSGSIAELKATLLTTAEKIRTDDIATCQAIGDHGLQSLPNRPDRLRILTHCNAGALATAGYGTALGVIRSAWNAGRLERVYADETRPRLQGAKLTTWECVQEGIPVTLISDNMAAYCMQQGLIDAVVVGADRIAANGDAANKIGTYSLAIVARAHNIPFFVAAPLSTIDFTLPDGSLIPIEERDATEVSHVGPTAICPTGVEFFNPAFDVTPAALIAGIVTEFGTYTPEKLIELKARLVVK